MSQEPVGQEGRLQQVSGTARADSLKLPYPLLSDFPNLQVIRSYGVLDPTQVMARRAFFLVDQQGIVRGKWLVENKEVFPSEELLKTAQVMAQKR